MTDVQKIAFDTLKAGAPGLSDQTREVLAGIIARKVALSTIPARAEAEGAAGEPVGPPREPTQSMMDALLYHSSHDTTWADAYTMWTNAHDAWFRDGDTAQPSPPPAADAGPDDPTEEMIQAGLKVDFDNEDERASVINLWHVMKAAAPPAADEDRVRIAVELINAEINAPLTGSTHGAWDRGRIAGLKEALAALKSTAAKEGEK